MLSTEILADLTKARPCDYELLCLFNLLMFYSHVELINQMVPRGSKVIENTFVLF